MSSYDRADIEVTCEAVYQTLIVSTVTCVTWMRIASAGHCLVLCVTN